MQLDSFIRFLNLSKTFVTSKMTVHALADVSFEVKENELVSIVGSSGCGKTTLLRILAGSYREDRGHNTRARQRGQQPNRLRHNLPVSGPASMAASRGLLS
jgi:ABC-type nitrate/sulfonate/bicarbonate transport system ATPase subunit